MRFFANNFISDLLREKNLPENVLIEYCRTLGQYFVVLERSGVLTAPLTFDQLVFFNQNNAQERYFLEELGKREKDRDTKTKTEGLK